MNATAVAPERSILSVSTLREIVSGLPGDADLTFQIGGIEHRVTDVAEYGKDVAIILTPTPKT
jgi:hypothetical protein